MAEGSSLGFIIFFIVFFSTIALFGNLGVNNISLSKEVTAIPNLDDYGQDLNILDYLSFVFNIVGYFILLQGLTLLGISSGIAAIIALGFDIGLIYVIARLVRGGG